MGGLFGGSGDIKTTAPVISSLRLQTSCFGRPVPWHFGKTRGAPNLIQYEDFTAVPHTTSQSTGGKGGGPKMSNTTYTYTVAMVMAICSGPIATIERVWKDKEVTSTDQVKLDVYPGDNVQQPHPYFVSAHPERALAYRGFAYVASGAYDLGDTATLENHSFEVKMPGAVSANVPDANVADVLKAILTDPEQGLGMPAAKIGDLSALSSFCLANGIWVSPSYTEQKEAYEYIRSLLQIGFADCVYSGGVFKVVPYSDTPAVGNEGSYAPEIAPVYALTEDDFLGDKGDDIIRVTRKAQTESYNHVQVKFLDRANDYNESIAEEKDQADIEQYGLRTMSPVEMHEICDAGTAQRVAQFLLRRSLYVRNEYEFRLPWSYALLEPMDVVTLTYPRQQLDGVPVLITKIDEEGDDGLIVNAEDFPLGASGIGLATPPTINGYAPDFSVDPGNATVPTLFEPPLQLTGGEPQLWLATSGAEHWGGCEVWVSTDNVSYRKIGSMTGPSRYGSLSAPLPLGAAIDTLNMASVDISASRGVLQGGTEENAQDLLTLCYVDGEYLAYADATLTGVGRYDLSYLVRGAYGTDVAAHAAGAAFVRVDDGLFHYAYPHDWLGKALWLKLVSFNAYGRGAQDLSTVPAHQYTIQGAPVGGVQNLRIDGGWNGRNLRLVWDTLDGAATYDVQVQAGEPMAEVRNVTGLTSNEYVYTPDDMAQDGGPWRQLVLKVRGTSITGRHGGWAQVVANNPQIPALSGIQLAAGYQSIVFKCSKPSDADFEGVLIWISAAEDFVPGPDTLVYSNPSTYAFLGTLTDGSALEQGQTYYLRAAGYDAFGKDSLNISSALAITIPRLVATEVLDGVVGESSLVPELGARIDKIDTPGTGLEDRLSNAEQTLEVLPDQATLRQIAAAQSQAREAMDALAAAQLTALVGADKSLAAAKTQLNARMGQTEAAVTQVQEVVTTEFSALAKSVETVQTTVDDNTATVQQMAQSVDGVKAQLFLKADVNGRVAGMAIGVDGVVSEISFVGDRFFIASQNAADLGQALFSVITEATEINGVPVEPGVYLQSAFMNAALIAQVIAGVAIIDQANIKEAAVGTAQIADLAVTSAKVGDIQSDGYAAGAAGWRIKKDGTAEFNNVTIRGDMKAGTISINGKFTVDAQGNVAIQSAASGQRTVINNSGGQVYDANGTLRVRWGIW